MIYRKKPDPTHHNYGRAQHPKTRFSGKINWLKLQVMGAYSNLSHSGQAITADPMFKQLKPEYQDRIATINQTARNCAMQLKDLIEEIAELNSPDKWAK